MRRRDFIAGVGTTVAWRAVANAQQRERMRGIGVLIPDSGGTWQGYVAVFREALAKLGWIEGRNVLVDLRFGNGVLNEEMRAQAAELVKLTPEVIVTYSGAATRAVRSQTQTIPIIVAVSGDNTFRGASATNIARPQGNVTGFALVYPSIAGKWLQFLKEVAPHLTSVGIVAGNPDQRIPNETLGGSYFTPIEPAAKELDVKLSVLWSRSLAEQERAIDAFAAEPNGGLIVLPAASTATRDNRQSILLLAARHRLPTIHWDRSYPAEGGLMSYGSDLSDLSRGAAGYVDRILRGSKVSDLSVQFPTKFEMVVNLKTARVLGLTIPETLLATADEVIQ